MCGVRMAHPMGTCPAQLRGSLWRLGLNDVGSCHKKSLGDVPQPGRSNTVLGAPCLQISNERGGRLPQGWCGWHTALHQIVIQRHRWPAGARPLCLPCCPCRPASANGLPGHPFQSAPGWPPRTHSISSPWHKQSPEEGRTGFRRNPAFFKPSCCSDW